MYDITITYPDAQCTSKGELYLPGEPLPANYAQRECALMCGELISYSHTHLGVIVDVDSNPMNSEPMHLRCVADAGEQYNVIGFTFGPEIPATGKHVAA